MLYQYCLGNHKLVIDDPLGTLKNNPIFDVYQKEVSEQRYSCTILRYEDQDLGINKRLLMIKDTILEGKKKERFYTFITARNIYMITDWNNKEIHIYVQSNSINPQSLYLFFTKLKRHFAYLISTQDYFVCHAGLIVDKEKNKSYLIMGPSGGGKSSICYYLLKRGMYLCADDMVGINKTTGEIEGGGGNLYVTEDFIQRFDIKDAISVSPYRKYKMNIRNTWKEPQKKIDDLLIASGQNDKLQKQEVTQAQLLDYIIHCNKELYECNHSEAYYQELEKVFQQAKAMKLYLNSDTESTLERL